MKGMDEVGRLFNANQMIVAEVLQSAEAMKAAVAYLEPHMEKADAADKGRIILATVKGDVHDIGKNLVDIILTQQRLPGDQPRYQGAAGGADQGLPRASIPTRSGSSGLLVKSAQMMVVTAQDLKSAGIRCPILVGGAALSARFTRMKIAPEYDGLVAYANDAMTGLDLANRIMNAERREELTVALARADRQAARRAPKPTGAAAKVGRADDRRCVTTSIFRRRRT